MATWLSLGSAADVDPSEGSYNSENASVLLGTYSSAVLSTVNAVGSDGNRDRVISDNDRGANLDTVSIDGTSMSLDSTIKFSATITRGDGTAHSTDVGVIQMTNGEVYLLALNETELDFMNIRAVELTAVVNSNYTGASVAAIGRSIDDTQIVCFTKGTPIATIRGRTDVTDLRIGDKVMTMDNGYQPICWIGKKKVHATGRLASVKIAKGALGPNIPERGIVESGV